MYLQGSVAVTCVCDNGNCILIENTQDFARWDLSFTIFFKVAILSNEYLYNKSSSKGIECLSKNTYEKIN